MTHKYFNEKMILIILKLKMTLKFIISNFELVINKLNNEKIATFYIVKNFIKKNQVLD